MGQAGFISINEAQFLSILVGVCEPCNLGLFLRQVGDFAGSIAEADGWRWSVENWASAR